MVEYIRMTVLLHRYFGRDSATLHGHNEPQQINVMPFRTVIQSFTRLNESFNHSIPQAAVCICVIYGPMLKRSLNINSTRKGIQLYTGRITYASEQRANEIKQLSTTLSANDK
jgi:hypothetical protein